MASANEENSRGDEHVEQPHDPHGHGVDDTVIGPTDRQTVIEQAGAHGVAGTPSASEQARVTPRESATEIDPDGAPRGQGAARKGADAMRPGDHPRDRPGDPGVAGNSPQHRTDPAASGPAGAAPRVVRQSNDLSYVHYAPRSAPEGLDRAAYVYPGPSAAMNPPQDRVPRNARSDRHSFFGDRPPQARVSLLVVGLLSFILPGAGHWYLGLRRVGASLMGIVVASWILAAATGFLAGVLLAGFWALFYPASIIWSLVAARTLQRRVP